MGGGTLSVSIFSADKFFHEVLFTTGNINLGGEDIDQRLMEYFLKLYIQKTQRANIESDKRAMQKIRREVERVKRALSQSDVARFEVDSLFEGSDFSESITRSKFEQLNRSLMTSVKEVLRNVKMKGIKFDEIVLVGGSTRIPKIRQLIDDYFPDKNIILNDKDTDQFVATGAAIKGGMISQASGSVAIMIIEVCPLTLGIQIKDGTVMPIIESNKVIPTQTSKIFSTATYNQENFDIKIFEKIADGYDQFYFLGNLLISNIPRKLRGEIQIQVDFLLDADNTLTVTAKELSNGQFTKTVIKPNSKSLFQQKEKILMETIKDKDNIKTKNSGTKDPVKTRTSGSTAKISGSKDPVETRTSGSTAYGKNGKTSVINSIWEIIVKFEGWRSTLAQTIVLIFFFILLYLFAKIKAYYERPREKKCLIKEEIERGFSGQESDWYEIVSNLRAGEFVQLDRCILTKYVTQIVMKWVKIGRMTEQHKSWTTRIICDLANVKLKHSHIVEYYKVHQDLNKENIFIFMEWAEKGSLREVYTQLNEGFSDSVTGLYTRQIILGLQYLHEKRIVHRDIKCDNILMFSSQLVKICDLEISEFLLDENVGLTTVCGTPGFMAPEITSFPQRYGFSVDIWSLGVTTLEMNLGKVPEFGILPHIRYQPTMSGKIFRFINCCLVFDKSRRSSLENLLSLLEFIDQKEINLFSKRLDEMLL